MKKLCNDFHPPEGGEEDINTSVSYNHVLKKIAEGGNTGLKNFFFIRCLDIQSS